MSKSFIHDTALISNSQIKVLKAYRNVVINNSKLDDNCSIGDETTIENCMFEKNVTINRRSYINDSEIGMYSYTGINTTINWTKMGRFCSLARNVDIGGFDHDYRKVTTMPQFRFEQMKAGGGKLEQKDNYGEYCIIGNDVWIAAGAQVLHKVTVGDGAVIGGGAVVTHDVPPYAIVVGVPAKIIGYRCKKEHISELLKICWWNWPEAIIKNNIERLISDDISDETISWMKEVSGSIY